jgi:hypothetical protein
MGLQVKMIDWFSDHWYRLELANDDGVLETHWIPSVTTKLGIINKPFLAKWRGDIGNREADARVWESQEKGSRIHDAWHCYVTGGLVVYNPYKRPVYTEVQIMNMKIDHPNMVVLGDQEEMLAIYKLDKFMNILNPKVIKAEEIVYSLKNNDAGTLDNLFEIQEGEYLINGSRPVYLVSGLYVADLKTGNMVDENAYRQTAAYANCIEEMGIGKVEGTIIMHTNSKTKTGIEGFSAIVRNYEQVKEDYEEYRLAAALWERQNKDASPRIFDLPSLIKMKKETSNEATTKTDSKLRKSKNG